MPTYEYQCANCEQQLEEFQYISDPPLKKCPACKKNKLRRLISGGAAIVFKGSGFYQTDYRSESYKKGASAESKSGDSKGENKTAENKSAESASSDAKPATKATESASPKIGAGMKRSAMTENAKMT